MPVAKPIGRWLSRTAAVADLRRQGLSPVEIAERLGISRSSVYSLIRHIRRRTGADTVRIPAEIGRQMIDEAAWRDLTVGQLALRIIETVVTEGLIAAVLDDSCRSDAHE